MTEPVVYVTLSTLLEELSSLGVELPSFEVKTLKANLFARRVNRDLAPNKKVKDGSGDWRMMNEVLLACRLHNKHQLAGLISTKDAAAFSHLKSWTTAAELVVETYKSDRRATYRLFCDTALTVMGNYYALNSLSRYLDRINGALEVHFICEQDNNPVVDSVIDKYISSYRLSNKFKGALREPENRIHFIRLVEKANSFEVNPISWLEILIKSSEALGQTLDIRYSYNSVATDKVSKALNLATNKTSTDDFLTRLNNQLRVKNS